MSRAPYEIYIYIKFQIDIWKRYKSLDNFWLVESLAELPLRECICLL